MELSYSDYLLSLKNNVEFLKINWDSFNGIDFMEQQNKPIFYFDMDGVLATWQTNLLSDFVMPNGDILPKGSPVTDELWNNPDTHYYASIPPYTEFVEYVNEELCKNPEIEVYVLTKSPVFAIDDKLQWLKTYLPNLSEDHILILPYRDSAVKSKYVPRIDENTYLFDDFSPNLRQWENAGGKAYNVFNGVNHPERNFSNIACNEEFDRTVLDIVVSEAVEHITEKETENYER